MWNVQAARESIREQIPLTPAVPIFGLVFGLVVAESTRVGVAAGLASNLFIFGGASQLASVLLLDAGGSAIAAILTITLINLRHVMYSAALQERFRGSPTWFRWLSSYFLIDQVFATNSIRDDHDQEYRQTYFIVSGLYWWLLWMVSVGAGVVIGRSWGDVIPDAWSLEFSAPLLFLSLMVMSIRNIPGIAAAAVSGIMAVALRDVDPQGTGLLVGACCGLATGAVAEMVLNTSDQHSIDSGSGQRREP